MFTQIELSYDFSALEPYIDALTMETHYTKHHAAYAKNLNAALEKASDKDRERGIECLLKDITSLPEEIRTAVRNNGGGFYNHNVYFDTMAPGTGGIPSGRLASQIDKNFGSFDLFKEKLSAASIARFGSGWGWLSTDKNGTLTVSSSANQDNPLMDGSGFPILGIDVWEHAYYLKYKNLRADYVKAFWNVIDWKKVGSLYEKAIEA
ncbi:superoxide dismutase [Parasphaerochaeta coccoides]|uniref:Superoxide dismutase n=1 Tax=Parasphaerochaeta coccoides (strain ATCC BAA-1237 / DSM 17374 / SPN1) TaxID=760011 RepID=F4GLB8_PARC1|nr:Manganese/iron superoxide dismutase [Parasphaerochaeta coccoides DSM 17374]